MALKRRVAEIATCSICLENYKSPRTLPCLHSFCLKCLQGLWRDKTPGAGVSCPLCRVQFQIPQKGLASLRVNFDLKNLVEADDVSSTASGYCNKHPDKRYEIYCCDCKGNICMKCCAVSHRQHRWKEIEEAAKDVAISVKSDTQPFQSHIAEYRRELTQVEREKKKFLINVQKTKQELQQRGDELKRKLDCHVNELSHELDQLQSRGEKDADTLIERYELAVTAMESFRFYSSELITKGSSCDITRRGEGLRVRAKELLQTYNTCRSAQDYHAPEVTFKPSNFDLPTTDGRNNIIGTLQKAFQIYDEPYNESPVLMLFLFVTFCWVFWFIRQYGP